MICTYFDVFLRYISGKVNEQGLNSMYIEEAG